MEAASLRDELSEIRFSTASTDEGAAGDGAGAAVAAAVMDAAARAATSEYEAAIEVSRSM